MAHGTQSDKQKRALHLVSGNANNNGHRCYLAYNGHSYGHFIFETLTYEFYCFL